jgi:glutaminyl-peptide cyclotransferase
MTTCSASLLFSVSSRRRVELGFQSWMIHLRLIAAAFVALGTCSCKRKAEPEATAPQGIANATAAPVAHAPQIGGQSSGPRPNAPPPPEIWKEFSGDKAFAEVKKQVDIGPRPSGSPENERARAHISETLRRHGWDVEQQDFTDPTPRGVVKFANVIGRFSATTNRPAPSTTQQVIVCSHYDTKRFSTISFVGANDGASSTGALLELARVLALDPSLAAKTELVFFDGEEAFAQFNETDGLYGSRFYARMLRERQRVAQFKFGILWDMIGDKDLTITLSPDSPQPLTQDLLTAAEALGLRRNFSYFNRPIWDDHVPLNKAHIPTADLIDFDYPAWHTADDTLDKLDPESLRKIGSLTLFHLHKTLSK